MDSSTPSSTRGGAKSKKSKTASKNDSTPNFTCSTSEYLQAKALLPPPDPPAALMNHDILTVIFEHFDLQAGSNKAARTRRDLLSAAKTCKAFVEPALNSLWRVLPSLLPLFLLLPSAEVSSNYYVSPKISSYLSMACSLIGTKFVDSLTSTNWERFDLHARRVKTLYMEKLGITISPHVYLRIRCMRDTPLLPGLKKIYIPDHRFDFSSPLLLVSQSDLDLVQLGNSATSDRQFCAPFLSLLSVHSPNLRHLALDGTSNISLDLIPRFRNLQTLDLKFSDTYWNSRFLQDLRELDNLLDMTLDIGPSTQSRKQQPHLSPSTTMFTKLRKLRILGSPMLMSRALDDMNVLTNLTTIAIQDTTNEPDIDTESSWKRCFAIISTFPAIEEIEITQFPHERWSSHYYLPISSFLPLYKLANVTSFVIKNSIVSGSDDDFRSLASAFPKLKKFVEPSAEYSKGRTLAVLLHVSQANPDLREMKISLASNLSHNLRALNALTPIQNHRHPLQKLYIASEFDSPTLQDMIQIAQLLDLIFPNLSTLEAYGSKGADDSPWPKIQQIRVALQAARLNAVCHKCEGTSPSVETC